MLKTLVNKLTNILIPKQGFSPLGGAARVAPSGNGEWPSLTTLMARMNLSTVPGSETEKMLYRMHRTGPIFKKRPKKRRLDGRPQMKGVVIRTLIKKPRKPNSANRKCVLLRLSNGKEAVAYVPGIGHNLQEHNVVLVEVSRLQDVPGVHLKVIRGKYDCTHVVKPTK